MAKVDRNELDKVLNDVNDEIQEDLDSLLSWQDECQHGWLNDNLYDSYYNSGDY